MSLCLLSIYVKPSWLGRKWNSNAGSFIMISQRMLQTKFKFQTPGGQGQAMAGAHKFRSSVCVRFWGSHGQFWILGLVIRCGRRWRASPPGLARSASHPQTANDPQVASHILLKEAACWHIDTFSEEADALRYVLWDQWLRLDWGGAVLLNLKPPVLDNCTLH